MSCRTIIPPYVLEHLATDADPVVSAHARAALAHDEMLRQVRRALTGVVPPGEPLTGLRPRPERAGAPRGPLRTISDAGRERSLPGRTVRLEGEPATGDTATDEAYDGLGATWRLWFEAFGRDSLDGHGMELLATVHYGRGYDNAFWDGTRMVFGDGDGVIFERFTRSLDVIGHELAHGVTEHTAGLRYRGQSGALNESVSDVFGVLVAQYARGEDAHEADWLVGADLLTEGVAGRALRDMRNPGTAYDDPRIGRDPQPAHMRDFVVTTADNGGVHINSGIPNRAFVLAALAIGGPAWRGAGRIWFDTLTGDGIRADCDFATFAELTLRAAAARHGDGSAQHAAVRDAWQQVGVLGDDAARGGHADEGAGAVLDPDEVHGEVLGRDAVLLLRRTGGFAGLVVEREVALGDLPDRDARTWEQLLTVPTLQRIALEQSTHPDAYCYDIRCDEARVDVSIPEPHLPEAIHSLFERTLVPGDD